MRVYVEDVHTNVMRPALRAEQSVNIVAEDYGKKTN